MNETAMRENPYAAPRAALPDELPRENELADRGTRLAAVLVDGLIFGFSIVPGIFVLAMLGPESQASEIDTALAVGLGLSLLLFGGVVVANCVLLARGGQTIAKRMLGILVLRLDGSHCGLGRIFFARYLPVTLLGLIPLVGGLVSLVDALLIFRDDRRCLHDEIADTIVVRA
jgi:uncharacterized RDD family membrane protein YckC